VFQAPGTDYAGGKVVHYLTLGTLALLTPIVLCRKRDDLDDLVWVLCWACAVVAVSAIVDPTPSSDYEGAPIQGLASSTIELGRAAGLVLIVAVISLATRRRSWWLAVGLAALGGTALLASGSRGPLAAAVVSIILGLVLAPGRRSKLTVAGAVLVAAGVIWIGIPTPPSTRSRGSSRPPPAPRTARSAPGGPSSRPRRGPGSRTRPVWGGVATRRSARTP
jgi:O-antigen ligase